MIYNIISINLRWGFVLTGFIFIDKPEGVTSFSAVNRVRRTLGVKKAGHTGTLDPMATGMLTVMLGGATRFSQYLPVHDKSYTAEILLGTQTDTLDITGTVTAEHPVSVSPDDIERVLSSFRGEIMQMPPMYSAVSKDGVRLYKLARQGIEIEREARKVTIYDVSVLTPLCENRFTVSVSCSAGTYIRSLTDDVGKALGCGAVLTKLRRTAANGFDISRAVTPEKLEELVSEGRAENVTVPCDELLTCYDGVTVSEKQAVRFSNGGELDAGRVREKLTDGIYRVYSPERRFLGLGRADLSSGALYVEKIFNGD